MFVAVLVGGCCLPFGDNTLRVRVKNVSKHDWTGSWTGSESLYNSPAIGALKSGETSNWRHYSRDETAYYGVVKARFNKPKDDPVGSELAKNPQIEWRDYTELADGDWELQCDIVAPQMEPGVERWRYKHILDCKKVAVSHSER